MSVPTKFIGLVRRDDQLSLSYLILLSHRNSQSIPFSCGYSSNGKEEKIREEKEKTSNLGQLRRSQCSPL